MESLIEIIKHSGSLGYLVLFLILFFESGLPLTFFLPGDSLLFTTGFLASVGVLNIWFLIPILFIGAVSGYIFGYGLGKRIGEKLFTDPEAFWFNPKRLVYARNFYDTYGVKTIVIGRFVPVVRSFGSTIAGAVVMDYKKFMFYNIVGGLAWTVGVTLLGFFLGRVIPGVHLYLTPIIIGIIFVSFIPVVIEYVQDRKKKTQQ